MGIANQLRTIDEGFRMIAAVPELKDKPIVIGESDPDGCAACQGPQLAYRNTTMYSSYTAAVFARKYELADRRGVDLDGAITWAFEFEDQPYFAGFRVMATNGLTLPVFNVFRMFSQMGGQRVAVRSSAAVPLDKMMQSGVRAEPDIDALASLEARKLSILLWNYHDDDVPGPNAEVKLQIAGLPAAAAQARIRQQLVDETHSNAYTAWKQMGSPLAPTDTQYTQLEAASQLQEGPAPTLTRDPDGRATLRLRLPLPRHAVSLVTLEW
jgi:xylan 1,4-beta-xylosidase